MRSLALSFAITAGIASLAGAESLLSFPVVGRGEPRFEVAANSDFWTSPFENKEAPQRAYRVLLLAPFPEHQRWFSSLSVETDGRIVSRPDLVMGENRIPVGPDLRSQSIGLNLLRRNSDQSDISFFLSYGSASDRPAFQTGTLSRSVSLLYKTKIVKDRNWLFGADWSENRGLRNGQVLPFLGVQWSRDPSWRWSFGFPFLTMDWSGERGDAAALSLSLVGARLSYIRPLRHSWSVFAESALSSRSYLHSDRQRSELRLILEEKNLETGVWIALSPRTRYSLRSGYAFERKLYEAREVLRPQGAVREIRSDFTLGFQLESLF